MTKIGPKELALKAQRETDSGIPSFLKRTETPEQAAVREKKNKPRDTTGGLKVVHFEPTPDKVRKAIEKDLRDDVADAADKLAKDMIMSDAKRLDSSPSKLLSSAKAYRASKKSKKRPKPGPMERKLAEALAKKEVSIPKQKHTNGSGKKTKLQIVADLLQRKQGCTTADVLKATGWPSVSMPAQAKAAGLKLKKEKDGNVTRYRA